MSSRAGTRLVLGVDSSTQSCKVEIRTEEGQLLATGSSPHPVAMAPISEQPAQAWWRALVISTRAAIAGLPAPWTAGDVTAIAIAAQCHGLVLLGADNEVLRPVKLWNDTTSAPQTERLRGLIGRARWISLVGSLPTAAFTIGKLAWVADHEPDVLAAARTVLLPHDWLTFCLTGEFTTDRSDASGTGYFDSTQNRYLEDLVQLAAGDHGRLRLPAVRRPDEPAGELLPGPAAELGLPAGTLIAAGGGDQHLSALGLGCRPGEVIYSIGTSGVVYTVSDTPVHDQSGMVDGVADASGRWLPLCSTLNAARVADTTARWLGVDHHELGLLADAAPAGADRPILVAYLDGERKPDLPKATGLLSGLTTGTTRESLALAGIEGLVLGLIRARDALTDAGVQQDDHVLVTGGGARLPITVQTLADFDGRAVYRTDVTQPVARGACIQALAACTGESIDAVTHRWRPPRKWAAEPRQDRAVATIMERYRRLSAYRGDDRR